MAIEYIRSSAKKHSRLPAGNRAAILAVLSLLIDLGQGEDLYNIRSVNADTIYSLNPLRQSKAPEQRSLAVPNRICRQCSHSVH